MLFYSLLRRHPLFAAALGAASCIVMVLPILTLVAMKFPWEPAVAVLEAKYPDETYIPVGFQLDRTSKDVRETSYLVVPSNVRATIRKEAERTETAEGIEYSERQGGLHTYIAQTVILVVLFWFIGLPYLQLRLMGKYLAQAHAQHQEDLLAHRC